jgi:hypothetical protein
VATRAWIVPLAAALVFALGGCFAQADADDPDSSVGTGGATALVVPESVQAAMADNTAPVAAADVPQKPVTVELGADMKDQAGVDVDGTTVTLTQATNYILSGTWAGQVVVDVSEGAVGVTLAGVAIESPTPGALVIEDADQVLLHLADGSANRLKDAGTVAADDEAADGEAADDEAVDDEDGDDEDAPAAALFSHADMIIDGDGALTVDSGAGDGVASKDGLVIASGTFAVTAADDAIRGKDYLVIDGGTFTLDAQGDGLKSTNDTDEALGYVLVNGGRVTVVAAEDGVQAATDVLIAGGELAISAGDDGVHAEKILMVEGGTITVGESYEGLEGQTIHIAGGDIFVTASDDGLNATDGSGGTGGGTAGDWAGGDRAGGAMPGGAMPGGAMPGADATAAPDAGDWPTALPTDVPVPDAGDWPTSVPTDVPMPGSGDWPTALPTDVPVPGSTADPGAWDQTRDGGRGGRGGMPGGGAMPTEGGFAGGMPGGGAAGGFGEGSGDAIFLISGGTLVVDAEGDGLDSNGTGSMTGGDVTVFGPTRSGNGALDVGVGMPVTGGTLVALDSGGMSQNVGSGSQASITLRLTVAGGARLSVQGPDGTEVAAYAVAKAATTLVFSSPTLAAGQTYTVLVDGTSVGAATAS